MFVLALQAAKQMGLSTGTNGEGQASSKSTGNGSTVSDGYSAKSVTTTNGVRYVWDTMSRWTFETDDTALLFAPHFSLLLILWLQVTPHPPVTSPSPPLPSSLGWLFP